MLGSDPQLEYITNHVFLPPKLPQGDDSSAENTAALVDVVVQATDTFCEALPEDEKSHWQHIQRMLLHFQATQSSTSLASTSVIELLSNMAPGGMHSYSNHIPSCSPLTMYSQIPPCSTSAARTLPSSSGDWPKQPSSKHSRFSQPLSLS